MQVREVSVGWGWELGGHDGGGCDGVGVAGVV